jgi:hypothetical protein
VPKTPPKTVDNSASPDHRAMSDQAPKDSKLLEEDVREHYSENSINSGSDNGFCKVSNFCQ